ncbi:MAG: hypothetical protein GY705_11650 [Bacteroidetes bacterium]|nr:hypothetical protein [Bacteroidota bacterium]
MLRKKVKVGSFFDSTPDELEKFLCGIGESEIKQTEIIIDNYPFEPSQVHPNRIIHFSEIDEIHLDNYPPTIKMGAELIFISREKIEPLGAFAENNKIPTTNRNANWQWITEPFLDTEYSEDQKERTIKILNANGISRDEVKQLRDEISKQMLKYNFDTMLWEWAALGLDDVLPAMRPKFGKEAFEEFYWKAMEIEQRKR